MKLNIFVLLVLIVRIVNAETIVDFDKTKWTELSYGKIEANKVTHSKESIKVEVKSSASPLIYKLDNVMDVAEFEVILDINGEMNSEKEIKKFEEDSYFRLGLVVLGDNKLGSVGSLFAPKWVKQLFKLAPEGAGLDKIYFYNVAKNKEFVGSERIHPQSKYMFEKVILAHDGATKTEKIQYKLKSPLKTAALWMSIDGDNTGSEFNVEIKNIKLK